MNSEGTAYTTRDGRALASVAVQFFMNGAAFASFVPRLPEIRERLGVGLDGLGLLMTIAITIGTVGGLRSPAVIGWLGSRRAMISSAALIIVGLAVMGVASTPIVFVLTLGAMSVADGVVDVAMNLQGSWLSGRRHAPVMNRLHGLWSLGTVVGGLAAAQAASSGVSLRVHLAVVSTVLLAGLVFVGRGLLTVDEGQHESNVDPPGEASGIGGAPRRTRAVKVALVVLAVSGGFSVAIELVSSEWAAFRLSEDFAASAGFAGLAYVAFTVGMTVGRLGGDSVAVRLGSDRLFRVAIVVTAVGLVAASFATNRWLVIAAYVVTGVGNSTFFPKLYDDAARHVGRRGAGLAWLRTGSSLTALALPTLVGVLAASRLSVGAAIAIVTLPCVAGLFALSLRSRPAG